MSSEELESKFAGDPPAGILVRFEAENEGFWFAEMGGLEWPLEAYAEAHGYRRLTIASPIAPGDLSLWARPEGMGG